jgi:glutamyl-Q tRNA(Asp) synthetase
MVRQSERHDAYAEVLDRLFSHGPGLRLHLLAQTTGAYHGIYPGCAAMPGMARRRGDPPARAGADYHFIDRVQGEFRQHLGREVGDFVIRRRDGLYAYQLAVVLDDAWQGDRYRARRRPARPPAPALPAGAAGPAQPRYLHIPLIVQPDGTSWANPTARRR